MNRIVLKMGGKKVIVDYNVLGLKQLIDFLELEEKQLMPAKKRRNMEIPMGVEA